jgi:hypothetical protein
MHWSRSEDGSTRGVTNTSAIPGMTVHASPASACTPRHWEIYGRRVPLPIQQSYAQMLVAVSRGIVRLR